MRMILIALLALLPTAAASPVLLWEDPAGDAGPLAAWGMPAPGLAGGHADLLSAALEVGSDAASVTLTLAALPNELPPDTVWAVGWERDTDGLLMMAGYLRVVTAEAPQGYEEATLCAFEGGPPEDAKPECVPIEAARLPAGFSFLVPREALGEGHLVAPQGFVVRLPDATVWPLFVAHFTGLTVEDVAEGEDVVVAVPLPTAVSPQSARAQPSAGVPLAPWVALVASLAAAAWVRRGRP